eukprot:NODE_725_length_1949_cov_25.513158_g671_i0.p1 GENE.NODE_725_length_1949_cov_25.513158_g671_i0~~NODE_725_length_1949_cov_25.513158_g671_i0.p1  ORF type:complete len:562 (+),score=116.49 NODE_725_length_1949_cov_25.513158_g671_i0:75-1760(+)
MIDNFTILHKGGRVLWQRSPVKVRGNPINQLVKSVLLEERSGETSFTHEAYKLHWLLANDLGLVFVVVYQKILQLLYIDELLQSVKSAFCAGYKAVLSQPDQLRQLAEQFDLQFDKILAKVELQVQKRTDLSHSIPVGHQHDADEANTVDDDPGREQGSTKKKFPKGIRPAARGRADPQVGPSGSSAKPSAKPKRVKQDSESWKEPKIDTSSSVEVSTAEAKRFGAEYLPQGEVKDNYEEIWEKPAADTSSKSGLAKLFDRLPFTSSALTASDLEPLLSATRERLVSKNVANDIADKLCESVAGNLVGTSVSGFQRTSTLVKEAMESALVRILTPKREINILRDIAACKQAGKGPYVIVFCGVNGVGKSTNLAKIAYWLSHNNQKVMLTACDTFRSGAVEQLRVHAQCLNVPLFERGYNKDAASIAAEGISFARKEKFDVVLVDTAGRMQDNEPLMRSLVKLINMNQPNLILFVGEALVGNDAVDQVSKFNQSLRDLADKEIPRLIDGIVLTKFDTIDDKVGAAISMVYTTGQPIVFVGVGQTYTDLRKLNASVVVDHLMQ